MGKELNRVYNYKGNQFNVKVELNAGKESAEFHTVIITSMGPDNWFYKCNDCKSEHLKAAINYAEMSAAYKIDYQLNKGKSGDQILLEEMGFK